MPVNLKPMRQYTFHPMSTFYKAINMPSLFSSHLNLGQFVRAARLLMGSVVETEHTLAMALGYEDAWDLAAKLTKDDAEWIRLFASPYGATIWAAFKARQEK